ncbi:two-component system osmolarity sensor histidine kinase EnvZ [Paraburkholderia sp. CI2]|uniref:ATP-binding protein n=1 Tax=Paraburkholderia sp. CI2 TaxID=2723093 RepID=UPI00180BC6DD|nr:ATP-binding protein [Paraburkholderia sp. CI2]MBB5468760.1 two-component system osmolarity sensor histidine kinase EnvZ [Paraburkholderia sp. CI2]
MKGSGMSVWRGSLFARNVLLLIVLMLTSQILVFAVYLNFIQKPRVDDGAALVASQIRILDRLLSVLPDDERNRQLLEMNGAPQGELPPPQARDGLPPDYMAHRFFGRLASELAPDEQLRWERDGHRIWVRLHVQDVRYWVALRGTSAMSSTLPWALIGLLLSAATLPALGAYLIHRPVEQALRRLARAAGTIERGVWPEAVPVSGPRELATVAEAFNRMASTLEDLEATRAEMLAGISHDIRTPLTKLRMAIFAPESFEAPAASAERFVEEIDTIVQQFIDFARGWDSEPATHGDLNALIEQLAADYAGLGRTFELSLAELPPVAFRPVGMQRLLMNLMQNAVVYGQVGLAVRTTMDARSVTIAVEDRGPGLPQELLSLIKQPFRRGSEADRKGGSGLGLAIAEHVAQQHGGTLDLFQNAPSGLKAVVQIPIP